MPHLRWIISERNYLCGLCVIWSWKASISANIILTTTSGPGRATGWRCVSVCVMDSNFELNARWPRHLACWFNLTHLGQVRRSRSKVKVHGQLSNCWNGRLWVWRSETRTQIVQKSRAGFKTANNLISSRVVFVSLAKILLKWSVRPQVSAF